MYQINNHINNSTFEGLKVEKLLSIDAKEVRLICLEKEAIFPKHKSDRNATLIVLEGEISFHINDKDYNITAHQIFDFPKDIEHWVIAKENSKFLIIR